MRQAKSSKALSKGKQRRKTSAEAPPAEDVLDVHQRPTSAPPRSGVQHSIPVFEPYRAPVISLKTG